MQTKKKCEIKVKNTQEVTLMKLNKKCPFFFSSGKTKKETYKNLCLNPYVPSLYCDEYNECALVEFIDKKNIKELIERKKRYWGFIEVEK